MFEEDHTQPFPWILLCSNKFHSRVKKLGQDSPLQGPDFGDGTGRIVGNRTACE
jgi:hypothetical protein